MELLLVGLVLSFTSSMLAQMIFFAFDYGHLLWRFKARFARKYFLKQTETFKLEDGRELGQIEYFEVRLKEMEQMTHTQAMATLEQTYNEIAHKDFLVGLMDCVFCLTIWISALVGLFIHPYFIWLNGFSWLTILISLGLHLLIICTAFFITKKS